MTDFTDKPRWPHQVRAFADTTSAIEEGEKRIVVTSPTGSGKTFMMIDLIQWAVEQYWQVALFTNRKLLKEQTKSVLESNGIYPGMRSAGDKPALLRPVQICMTQTEAAQVLARGRREFHDAQLIIIDEGHIQKGNQMQKILDYYKERDVPCVSYTATPLDMSGLWDYLIIGATMSECFACGALVPAEGFSCDEPDLKYIKRYQVGQDISEKDNVKAIMRPGIVGRVLDHWLRLNPDQLPTVGFGPDCKGALYLAEGFWKKGIRTAYIDGQDVWLDGEFIGTDNLDARDYVLELLRAGDVKLIWNRFVLREGIDLPDVQHIILASVFGSLSSYIQTCGRGLRAAPGKEKCVIQDHGGNYNRLGSVNSDREWDLSQTNDRVVGERQERMRQKVEPEPFTCPKCFRVYMAIGRGCPACGYVATIKSRIVVQIDGTLKRVEGDLYVPRKVRQQPDTTKEWERLYWSQRRAGRTFNQAYAWFYWKHGYWPPKTLPMMPKRIGDWFSKVGDVPQHQLNGSEVSV